ncbi:MAG: hypothetical protein WC230_04065 [Bacteroidales bacterium]
MKKIVFLFLAILPLISVFAQDDLSETEVIKNDGIIAYNQKDYITAINHWEKYLNSGAEGVADDIYTLSLYESAHKYAGFTMIQAKEYETAFDYFAKYASFGRSDTPTDGNFLFNYANLARRLKKDTLALDLYDQCMELKYREDATIYSKALIYKDREDIDKMKEVLVQGLENYPESQYSKNMSALLSTQLAREASKPFNEANSLAGSASSTNIDSYISTMSKATEKYKEAIVLFEEVLKYDPENKNASKYIDLSKENVKRFEDYKKSIGR